MYPVYTPYKSVGENVTTYQPFTQGLDYYNIPYQPTNAVAEPMNAIGVKKWAIMGQTPFFKPFVKPDEYPAFKRIGGLPEKQTFVAY